MSDPTGRTVTRQELSAWLQQSNVNGGDEGASPEPARRTRLEPNRKRTGPTAGWRRRSSLEDDVPGPLFGIDHATALLTARSPAPQGEGSTVSVATSGLGASPAGRQCRQGVGADPMGGIFNRSEGGPISSPLFQRPRNKSLPFQNMQLSPRQQSLSRSMSLPGNCAVTQSSSLPEARESPPLRHSRSMPSRGLSRRQTMEARESHLLEAMERSRRSQDHGLHTRRSVDLTRETIRTRALIRDALGGGPGGASSPTDASIPRRASAPAIQSHKARNTRASIDSISSWRKQQTTHAMLRSLMMRHIEEKEKDEKENELMSKFERHLCRLGGLTGRHRPGPSASCSKAAHKTDLWKPSPEADRWRPAFERQRQFRQLGAKCDVEGADEERAVRAELERIVRSFYPCKKPDRQQNVIFMGGPAFCGKCSE